MGARSLLSGVVALGLLAAGGYALTHELRSRPAFPLTSQCEVTGSSTVALEAGQMAHAATIGAVGLRRGVPTRAVAVALATALQESKLRNLAGGDRDSIGLFQQRPSQGWGTPRQLRDPRYAAGVFYDKLLEVPKWRQMRLTEAAQTVQKSAHPEAYQKWAEEGEVLAAGLSGAAPGSVTCTLRGSGEDWGPSDARALEAAIKLDWGEVNTGLASQGRRVALTVRDGRSGWRLAHWLVAHAAQHGVSDVRYAGRRWNAEAGGWSATAAKGKGGAVDPRTVIAEM